jgi:hypothetical protein
MQLREHISGYESNLTRSSRNVKLIDILNVVRDVFSSSIESQNFASLALPFTRVQTEDIRMALDNDLKKYCQGFILSTARTCIEPILRFLKEYKIMASGKDDVAFRSNPIY